MVAEHKVEAPVMYSYDNPSIHKAAEEMLEKMGITQNERVRLPPYSPDMHKVIEHAHANVARIFQNHLRAVFNRQPRKIQVLLQKIIL